MSWSPPIFDLTLRADFRIISAASSQFDEMMSESTKARMRHKPSYVGYTVRTDDTVYRLRLGNELSVRGCAIPASEDELLINPNRECRACGCRIHKYDAPGVYDWAIRRDSERFHAPRFWPARIEARNRRISFAAVAN
jgi:hypothetical protein